MLRDYKRNCPCPHHPFGCFGHPATCECAKVVKMADDEYACPACGDKTRSVIQCAIECRARNEAAAIIREAFDRLDDIASSDPRGRYGRLAREAKEILAARIPNEPQASAGNARARELADYIEQSTPPTYMDDVMLDRADREVVIAALRRMTGEPQSSSVPQEEDCGCIGAVIGQHERSCPLSRPKQG